MSEKPGNKEYLDSLVEQKITSGLSLAFANHQPIEVAVERWPEIDSYTTLTQVLEEVVGFGRLRSAPYVRLVGFPSIKHLIDQNLANRLVRVRRLEKPEEDIFHTDKAPITFIESTDRPTETGFIFVEDFLELIKSEYCAGLEGDTTTQVRRLMKTRIDEREAALNILLGGEKVQERIQAYYYHLYSGYEKRAAKLPEAILEPWVTFPTSLTGPLHRLAQEKGLIQRAGNHHAGDTVVFLSHNGQGSTRKHPKALGSREPFPKAMLHSTLDVREDKQASDTAIYLASFTLENKLRPTIRPYLAHFAK